MQKKADDLDPGVAVYRQLIRQRAVTLIGGAFPLTQRILGLAKWRSLFRSFFHEYSAKTPYYTVIANELIEYADQARSENAAMHLPFELLAAEERLRFMELAPFVVGRDRLPSLSLEASLTLHFGVLVFHHTYDFLALMLDQHNVRYHDVTPTIEFSMEAGDGHASGAPSAGGGEPLEAGHRYAIVYKTGQNEPLRVASLCEKKFMILLMLEQPKKISEILAYNCFSSDDELITFLQSVIANGWVVEAQS